MENREVSKKTQIGRMIFIIAILVLFIICFTIMNNKYDPLARYPYANSSNRDLILEHFDDEEIDYIVTQKIQPSQFEPFIRCEHFDVKKTVYYDAALKLRPASKQYIVNFVNSYAKNMRLDEFENYITAYSYKQLTSFFNGEYLYDKEAKLIQKPQEEHLVIKEHDTLYQYRPKDLVKVSYSDIPYMTSVEYGKVIEVKKEVLKPMVDMANALGDVVHKESGGLILVSGYLSYDQQINLYNKELAKYGSEEVRKHLCLPGCNEEQLGYTVSFTIANTDSIKNSKQYKWLKDNAHKYGFILRYPDDKEDITKMNGRKLTFRYVGEQLATQLYNEQKTLEEIKQS